MTIASGTKLWQKAAAFAAVYLIWGSTYVVIKFAIDTLPPFLMAGTRYVTAGIILWLFMRGRDRTELTRAVSTAPSRREVRRLLSVNDLAKRR